jgi:hypothetical protein
MVLLIQLVFLNQDFSIDLFLLARKDCSVDIGEYPNQWFILGQRDVQILLLSQGL